MADRNTAFKDLTFKEKIQQIWDYYKPVIFGIAFAVWLIIYIIYKILNPDPDVLMTAVLMNSSTIDVAEKDVFTRYLEENGYNPEEETISTRTNLSIDTENAGAAQITLSSQQVLMAMLSAGEVDLLVGTEDSFDMLGTDGLMRAEEILPTELAEKYRDRFYIVKNQETGEKLAGGIWLEEGNPLMEDGYYHEKMLVGIPTTATNVDMAKELLLILLEE